MNSSSGEAIVSAGGEVDLSEGGNVPVGGAGNTQDAALNFEVSGGDIWSTGIDASDTPAGGRPYKIARGNDLSVNERVEIAPTGQVSLPFYTTIGDVLTIADAAGTITSSTPAGGTNAVSKTVVNAGDNVITRTDLVGGRLIQEGYNAGLAPTISDNGQGLFQNTITITEGDGGGDTFLRMKKQSDSNGQTGVVNFQRARTAGEVISDPVVNNNQLGVLQFDGWDGDGVAPGYRVGAIIRARAKETWSATTTGTEVDIRTNATGETSANGTSRLLINDQGNVVASGSLSSTALTATAGGANITGTVTLASVTGTQNVDYLTVDGTGTVSASAPPAGAGSLQAAYNGGNDIVITAGNPVEMKSGLGLNTQNVLEIKNDADATFASITGEGRATFGLTTVRDDANGSTIVGRAAGQSITGLTTNNTVVGDSAGFSLTTGTQNTCVGLSAGEGITTGGSNTCLGTNAGENLNSGSNRNVVVGTSSDATGGLRSDCIVLGTNATTTTDRQFVAGSSTVGQSLTTFVPGTTNECDLGTSTTRWKDSYFSGLVGLGNLANDPTGTSAGQMYWNTASSIVRVFNGTTWEDLGTVNPGTLTPITPTIVYPNTGAVFVTDGPTGTAPVVDGHTITNHTFTATNVDFCRDNQANPVNDTNSPYRVSDNTFVGNPNGQRGITTSQAYTTLTGVYNNSAYTTQTTYIGQGGGTVNGAAFEFEIPVTNVGGYALYLRPDTTQRDVRQWAVFFSQDAGTTWEAVSAQCLKLVDQTLPAVVDINTERKLEFGFGANTTSGYNRMRVVIVATIAIANTRGSFVEADALTYM